MWRSAFDGAAAIHQHCRWGLINTLPALIRGRGRVRIMVRVRVRVGVGVRIMVAVGVRVAVAVHGWVWNHG